MGIDTKKCLVCKRKNNTLHWHIDSESGAIWVWCQGKCQRGYSLYEYCRQAGVSLKELLKGDFDFRESTPNEVRKMEWPHWFIPLSDMRAKNGVEYIKSRGLTLEGEMYYDMDNESIVFPYHFKNVFVGSQMRFLHPKTDEDGEVQKMDTLPGTRLGYLFYGWNQDPLPSFIKGVIITEGAFNALAIQQALNTMYGGITKNPFKVIAASGSGASEHQIEVIAELKNNGYKTIVAPDSDKAGLKMLSKYRKAESITHFALTEHDNIDWNDAVKAMGHEEFAKWFIGRIKNVKS